jgi:hypothetical protein
LSSSFGLLPQITTVYMINSNKCFYSKRYIYRQRVLWYPKTSVHLSCCLSSCLSIYLSITLLAW